MPGTGGEGQHQLADLLGLCLTPEVIMGQTAATILGALLAAATARSPATSSSRRAGCHLCRRYQIRVRDCWPVAIATS